MKACVNHVPNCRSVMKYLKEYLKIWNCSTELMCPPCLIALFYCRG